MTDVADLRPVAHPRLYDQVAAQTLAWEPTGSAPVVEARRRHDAGVRDVALLHR